MHFATVISIYKCLYFPNLDIRRALGSIKDVILFCPVSTTAHNRSQKRKRMFKYILHHGRLKRRGICIMHGGCCWCCGVIIAKKNRCWFCVVISVPYGTVGSGCCGVGGFQSVPRNWAEPMTCFWHAIVPGSNSPPTFLIGMTNRDEISGPASQASNHQGHARGYRTYRDHTRTVEYSTHASSSLSFPII